MSKWTKIGSKEVLRHPRLSLDEHEVELPDGNTTGYLVFNNKFDFPTVIALEDDGRIVMVREHAYPINEALVQFPEGMMEADETDPLAAAARELAQETGRRAGKLAVIGSCLYHHRRSTSTNYIVLATGLSEGETDLEMEEQGTEVVLLTEEEIWKMIASGEIIQKNTLSAWAIYQAFKREAKA